MGISFDRKNNAYVTYDDLKASGAWLEALGTDVVKKIIGPGNPTDDTTGDPTEWTSTVVEVGGGTSTVVNSTTVGEAFLVTTAANEYDGTNFQLKGESFKLESGKPLYFGCKISVSDATQSDLLVGLCETDTTLMATSSAHAVAVSGDGVFFSKLDGSTTINAHTYLDGSETHTAAYGTALDTDAIELEIYWNGTTVYFYAGNSLVTSVAASLPDGDLTLSYNFRAGEAAAKTSRIVWMRCIQLRG